MKKKFDEKRKILSKIKGIPYRHGVVSVKEIQETGDKIDYILKDEEGKEVARFQDIEEARKYDRMLDAADGIFDLFSSIKELDGVKENIKDEISFQIARHSEEIMEILGRINSRKKTAKKKTAGESEGRQDAADDAE